MALLPLCVFRAFMISLSSFVMLIRPAFYAFRKGKIIRKITNYSIIKRNDSESNFNKKTIILDIKNR